MLRSSWAAAVLTAVVATAACEGVAGAATAQFRESAQLNLGATDVALGDFGGDERPDYAVAEAAGFDRVELFGNSEQQILYPGNGKMTTGANPVAIAAGDLNGDGDTDVVTANLDVDSVTVGLGTGQFGL